MTNRHEDLAGRNVGRGAPAFWRARLRGVAAFVRTRVGVPPVAEDDRSNFPNGAALKPVPPLSA